MKNNELLRSILEQFLSIFDQSNRLDSTGHVLVINEADYPEKFHPVIRRLNKALQSPQIEDNMDMEDEVVGEFNKQSEMIEEIKARMEAGMKKLGAVKQKMEAAKQKAEAAKQKAEVAKQKAEAKKQAHEQLIKNLANSGMSRSQVAGFAEISEAEVARILREEKD